MKYNFFKLLSIFYIFGDILLATLFPFIGLLFTKFLYFFRIISVVLIGFYAFIKIKTPRFFKSIFYLYFFLIILYSVKSFLIGIDNFNIFSTAISLIFPFLLFYIGYFFINNNFKYHLFINFYCFLALASTFFGLYEINNTYFWTDLLKYPDYLINIKGISNLTSNFNLPFNFFYINEDIRRSAGLVAAPLANSTFLSFITILFFSRLLANFSFKNLCYFLILFVGLFFTYTKSGILIAILSIIIIFLCNKRIFLSIKIFLSFFIILLLLFLYYDLFYKMFTLSDGSSYKHLFFLINNLLNMHDVIFFGFGVGTFGSKGDPSFFANYYPGEGAIFTIIYQLGLIGGIIFLLFYFILYKSLNDCSLNNNEVLPFKVYLIMLSITLVTSEHFLTLSGMVMFWFSLGGFLRVFYNKINYYGK